MSLSAAPTNLRPVTVTSNDGTQIYAEASGSSSNPAIVFIHALGMSSGAFTPILEDPKWSERFQLVTYDLRGHGRSGKPVDDASYESKRLAEDFDAVMDAFSLKKPVVLGCNIGASIIADILTFHPRTYLSGIIYLEAVPYLGQGNYLPLDIISDSFSQYILPFMSSGAMNSIEEFQQTVCFVIERFTRSSPYSYQRAMLGDTMLTPKPVLTQYFVREQDEKGLLKARDEGLPLLVLNTKLSEMTDRRRMMSAIGNWKNLKVVDLENADHFPWFSDPDAFRKEMANWAEQVSI